MSLDLLWMESLQRAITKHFREKSIELSIPFDFDDSLDGDKVSVQVMNSTLKKINSEEHLAEFTLRFVCTISTEGLYDLSSVSGKVASLLMDPIVIDASCAEPVNGTVNIEYFPFTHGYKQSLMNQVYTSRLRG